MRRSLAALLVVLAACSPAEPVAQETLPATPADRGALLYNDLGCAVCHAAGSQLGPDLAGIWGQPRVDIAGTELTVDADYIRSSIVFPNQVIVGGFRGRMPPYFITDQEIADIAAFVESIG